MRRAFKFTSLGVAAVMTVFTWGVAAGTGVAASAAGAPGPQPLVRVGRVNVRALPGVDRAMALPGRASKEKPESAAAGASPIPVPNPPNSPVTLAHPGATGFNGINAVTSGRKNGFDVEPPDLGLCASHGVVMEQVNLAVRIYTDTGAALTRPVSLNDFFAQPPDFDPATKKFGPFLSDPRCYYDPQVGRWFSTALEIDVNPSTGAFGQRSSLLIAVSSTSDAAGDYAIFAVDTTDNGRGDTQRLPHCPCFGDQPRIGADANGFYVSTDIYPIKGLFNSNGGALYALSKTGLAAAAAGDVPLPTLVNIHVGASTIQGFPANALQPAQTPPQGVYAPNTEYFLSTPDFNGFATSGGRGAEAVVVWALRGTQTLNGAHPDVHLSHDLVPSEPYAPPVAARQKPGPRPLGTSRDKPLPKVSVNDDRMQQVIYTGGMLTSSLNTGAGPAGTATKSAVAWFMVRPTDGAAGVTATMERQGYVAVAGASLAYPAIGLDATGNGAMVFSLIGQDFWPSAAYAAFDRTGPHDPIHVNGLGVAPEDGFTCYPPYSHGTCRWGDYSAAVAEDGAIIMGTEYIPGPRDVSANWGTFLTRYSAH